MLLALLAGGCSRAHEPSAEAAGDGTPRRGGEIVLSLPKEPPIINPWLAPGAMAATWMLIDGLNDPLATMDDRGRWRPVIATEIPTMANRGIRMEQGHMVVRFGMRPEARWSDGTPITCDDVRFTWQVVVDPHNQLSNRLGFDHVEQVDCPDPTHVVITMKGPYALFMSRIMAQPPLPAHELRGKDFNVAWNDRITVSSGPYLFDEWQRGVKLVLVRNPRWWRAGPERLPYIDRVVFRFVKDANTSKMQLRMTEADAAWLAPDTNLIEELRATPDVEFASVPGALVELLEMQTGRPPLDDVDVRRAVAHAIDREMIAKVVLRGQVEPMQQVLVPFQPAYDDDPYARYRPDGAKVASHMEAAGYRKVDEFWEKGGKRIHLTYVVASGYPYRMRVSQLIQQQLRRQGIDMEIQLITSEVLYTQVAPKGNFDLGEWSELTGIEPAPEVLFGCIEVPRKPQWAGKNRMRYCTDGLDERMAHASSTIDVAARARLMHGIEDDIADAAPLVPLFRLPDTMAWGTHVHGIHPNAASLTTWDMDGWWVDR